MQLMWMNKKKKCQRIHTGRQTYKQSDLRYFNAILMFCYLLCYSPFFPQLKFQAVETTPMSAGVYIFFSYKTSVRARDLDRTSRFHFSHFDRFSVLFHSLLFFACSAPFSLAWFNLSSISFYPFGDLIMHRPIQFGATNKIELDFLFFSYLIWTFRIID